MRVTYERRSPENVSILHPVYKQVAHDVSELCMDIRKTGNCWYLYNWGGYVIHGIEPERVKEIVTNNGLLFHIHLDKAKHLRGEKFCYEVFRDCRNGNGSCFCSDFDGVMEYIRQENVLNN